MNLNKIGFWAILTTAFLVTFLMTIDSLANRGIIPQSAKCTIITWSIIFIAIFITMKLLSIFERINNELKKLSNELDFAQLELNNLYLEETRYRAVSNFNNINTSVASKIIPFPVRKIE